jgi:hypothetical protein
MQINKNAKQNGKAIRRANIAVLFGLDGVSPLVIPDGVNNPLPLVVVVVVFNFISRLPCSVRAQEKEALYRLL